MLASNHDDTRLTRPLEWAREGGTVLPRATVSPEGRLQCHIVDHGTRIHAMYTLSDVPALSERSHPSMTIEDYLAYVREYQQQLLDAAILARAGLADPTIEEQEEMDALYCEEDPFEEQAVVWQWEDVELALALLEPEEEEEDEEEELVPLKGGACHGRG